MALSLTYDGVLSRVRITGTGLTVTDNFSRTVANGWGTATTGQVWTTSGGVAADYSVNGTQGLHSVGVVASTRRTIIGSDLRGAVASIQAKTNAGVFPSGARIETGLLLPFIDANNYYAAHLFFNVGGSISVRLLKRVNTVATTLAETVVAGLTHSSDTFYTLKAHIADGQLKVKAWRSIDPEPGVWHAEWTDSALTGPGQLVVESLLATGNTNTLPVVLPRDELSVVPFVLVERSTNQVTWSTVRGGTALVPVNGAISLDDYEFAPDVINYYRAIGQTANITPVLDGVWLKSLARPFLNRKVTPRDFSPMSRASRGGVFPIVGRSAPVAVTELHGSRRWTLELNAYTDEEAEALDLLISTGEVQFIHVPTTGRLSAVPGGYVALGDTAEEVLPTLDLKTRVFSLSLTQVAAPGPDVVPAIGVWQSVINSYASWNAVLAAHADWASLLQLVGSPADVVVP